MWIFDLETEEYSPIPLKSSNPPSPRSEVAHARIDETIILFGGKTDTELMNDLYIYDLRSNQWELIEVNSSDNPFSRRSACLAASNGFFILFGGITTIGYNNELWKFDWGTRTYKLLNSINAPPVSAFSQCHIELNSKYEPVFRVYMGETKNEYSVSFVYEYNLKTDTWSIIKKSDSNVTWLVKSSVYMIDDTVLELGGTYQNYYSYKYIYILNTKTQDLKLFEMLPRESYYAASAFYKDKIYIHGGALSFNWLPLRDYAINDLIIVELNENCESEGSVCIQSCSKGTYFDGDKCCICPAGSYSDRIGSKDCNLCPRGYYSDYKGADSAWSCKPCPNGYFNYEKGQTRCLECPNGSKCSFDNIELDTESTQKDISSVQPELIEYRKDFVDFMSETFDLSITAAFSITILLLLGFYKTRKFATELDIYSVQHNYEDNKPMYIRKTILGGLFSIAFMFAAISILFKLSLNYALNNIDEKKALVPLVALEQEYKHVISI